MIIKEIESAKALSEKDKKLLRVVEAAKEFLKNDIYNFPEDVDQCYINNLITSIEDLEDQ